MTMMIRIGNIAPPMVTTSYTTSEGSDELIPRAFSPEPSMLAHLMYVISKISAHVRLTIAQTGKVCANKIQISLFLEEQSILRIFICFFSINYLFITMMGNSKIPI